MRFAMAMLVLCGLAAPAWADWFGGMLNASPTAKVSNMTATTSGQAMKAARVRWLDKQTNRVTTLVMQAGTTQTPNGMKVVMTNCLADYGGVPGQDVAWMEVREDHRDAPWFAGWMFNTYPEIATLDHPRFDLELVGCGEQPRRKLSAPVKPEGVQPDVVKPGTAIHDSEAPGAVDTESGGDAATPENDPYYVPGVENPSRETPAPADAVPADAATPDEASATMQPAAVPESERVEPLPGSVPTAPEPAGDSGELQRMMDSGHY